MAEKHIKKLAQHCEIVAYHIFDPFEASSPETSITQSLPITDGTNEQHVTLGDKKQQRHYQLMNKQFHVNTLTERLKRSQVISINAGEPLLSQFEGKGMNNDPLANMRDIHLAEPISQFPMAVGWWVSLLPLLMGVAVIVRLTIRLLQRRLIWRHLMNEIEHLSTQDNWPMQIMVLLKRVCHNAFTCLQYSRPLRS